VTVSDAVASFLMSEHEVPNTRERGGDPAPKTPDPPCSPGSQSTRCPHNADTSFKHVRVYMEFVYYESINRDLKIRSIYECRCDERLQTKTKEFTRLTYTGLVVELEHLKIETRSIDEKFANVMCEYVT